MNTQIFKNIFENRGIYLKFLLYLTFAFKFTPAFSNTFSEINESNVRVAIEDIIGVNGINGMSNDFDGNDVVTCNAIKAMGNSIDEMTSATISISSEVAGASYKNALYVKNLCNGPARIQYKKFGWPCEYFPEIDIDVPQGEYIKLADSFTIDAFSLNCNKRKLINTILDDPLDCPGKKAYMIIDCYAGYHIPTPGGVFPIEELYRIDPFLNGLDDNSATTDDVWYGRENNLGLYNIYVGQCGENSDPIPEENVTLIDALGLRDNVDYKSNCTATGNGNACREAIKKGIKDHRALGWEAHATLNPRLRPKRPQPSNKPNYYHLPFLSTWQFSGLDPVLYQQKDPIYTCELPEYDPCPGPPNCPAPMLVTEFTASAPAPTPTPTPDLNIEIEVGPNPDPNPDPDPNPNPTPDPDPDPDSDSDTVDTSITSDTSDTPDTSDTQSTADTSNTSSTSTTTGTESTSAVVSSTSTESGSNPNPPPPPPPPCPQCGCNGQPGIEITIIAEQPEFQFSSSISDEVCRGITSDANGDIICVGHTSGNLFELNGGGEDIIAVKFNTSGELLWYKQLGSTTQSTNSTVTSTNLDDLCLSIATDSAGNIYCGGKTASTLSTVPNLGGDDAFIMKLSQSGDIIWINQFGDAYDDVCNDLVVDSNDNVYCVGTTYSDFVESVGNDPNHNTSDIFVVKVNSAGLFQWQEQFGKESEILDEITTSSGDEEGLGIEMTDDGNLVVAGFSSGSFFNQGAGVEDALILKLNSTSGDLIWASQFGGIQNDRCNSVDVDSDGYIYCGGFSEGQFGDLVPTTNATGDTAMVIKLHPDGQWAWGKRVGNVGSVHPNSNSTCLDIEIDSFNNIYCGGGISTTTFITKFNANPKPYHWREFLEELFFGDKLISVAEANTLPADTYDILIFKLDSGGNLVWRNEINKSNGEEVSYDLHLMPTNVLLSGGYKNYFVNNAYQNKDILVTGLLASGQTSIYPFNGSMVTTWEIPASSLSLKLPLSSAGTYNFTVDWGDGNQSTITSHSDPEARHVYASAGTYTVQISGTLTHWDGSNYEYNGVWPNMTRDTTKLIRVDSLGDLGFENLNNAFTQTTNLTSFVGGNTSNVTDMSGLFMGSGVTSVDVSTFDTSSVTNMSWMFGRASNIQALDLSNFNTTNVTDMSYMFHTISSLVSLDLTMFDTSNVTSMDGMFSQEDEWGNYDGSQMSLISLDISTFDTSNVTNMMHMFAGFNINSLNVSNFDTSNVTSMYAMFESFKSSNPLDLSNFVTTNAYLYQLFANIDVPSLNLSNWNTDNHVSVDKTNLWHPFYNVNFDGVNRILYCNHQSGSIFDEPCLSPP